MGNNLAGSIVFVLIFRANESIFQLLFLLLAILAVCSFRPNASARILIEVKSADALRLDIFAIDASVENIADGLIRMRKDSILSRTVIVRASWRF